MAAREGWKCTGLIKGLGIPAPTGQYTVGCVDLMHKLEGDDDGLLVRLFYPTIPQLQEGAGFQYAKWTPHKRYTKGFLEFNKSKMAGLLSSIVNLVLDPRLPAFDGAPLFHNTKAATATKTNKEEPPKSETVDKTNGNGENGGDPATTGGLASEVIQEEEPSPKEIQFPVIVFSHGLGAMRTVYSAICVDLASHGYVIASVEHRDRSAAVTLKRVPKPGGQEGELMDEWLEFYHRPESEAEFPLRNNQVKQRAFDVRQGLNLLHLLNDGGDIYNMLEGGSNFDYGQFKGRLDVDTAAVMGHSFGGGTTVQTLSEDPRFLCGIALDTWMYPVHQDILNGPGIQQPLLFINSFDFQWKENVKQIMKLTRAPDERGISQCSLLTLKDTNHYNQSDVLFVMPLRRKWMSRLPPYQAHQINQDLCHAFLKRNLLKDPAYQQRIPDLDGGEGCSEFILLGSNVDISDPPAEGEPQEGAKTEVEGALKDIAEMKTENEAEEGEKKTEYPAVEGEGQTKEGKEEEGGTDQKQEEEEEEEKKNGEEANEQQERSEGEGVALESSDTGQAKL